MRRLKEEKNKEGDEKREGWKKRKEGLRRDKCESMNGK